MNSFVCPYCGNSNPKYIGYNNGKPYCRRCINFRHIDLTPNRKITNKCEYSLKYSLTKDQKELSDALIINYVNKKDSLVSAVTGAGKTEIVLEVIKYAITHNQHVGFCVPRRDVVIELYKRFAGIFVNNKVIAIYGGNTKQLEADLVVLTSHQLFRYNKYFDLLIMDEIDAFPFSDNFVLNSFFERALKGSHILLTATATPELIDLYSNDKRKALLNLYSRFHMQPLPVPTIKKCSNAIFEIAFIIKKLKEYQKGQKPVFIFSPTIEKCEELYRQISVFIPNGTFVHSQCIDRNEKIEKFRKNEYKYLVTTSVLERGVTVKNLQVIVYMSDHAIYNRYSLIQIAGRAGRKKEAPDGEVIFMCKKENEEIKNSIRQIIDANNHLQ